MPKVANAILYMMENSVSHLNDRKVSILLFLIDYEYHTKHNQKVFGDSYLKTKRNPEPVVLAEIFDIIANNDDLEEGDERLYLIEELFEYIDMEIHTKDKFIELKFLDIDEKFDKDAFSKDELKVLKDVVSKHKNSTSRNVANATFAIEAVRQTQIDSIII
jgi:hypothetical protein